MPGITNGIAATTDTFQITGVVILPGIQLLTATQSPNIMRPYDQELLLCQRYYAKSYNYSVLPGTVSLPGALFVFASTFATAGVAGGASARFPVTMRVVPTVVGYSPTSGAAGKVSDNSGGPIDVTANFANIGEKGFQWYALSASTGVNFSMHYTADARL